MSSLPFKDIAAAAKAKKIKAFDLDGTLAESKQALNADMGQLIAQLLEKSSVAVISGGSFNQFKKQFLSHLPAVFESNAQRNAENQQTGTLFLLPVSGSQRYEYDQAAKDWIMTDSMDAFPEEEKEKIVNVLKDFEATYAGRPEFSLPAETYGPRIEERGTQITFSALGQSAPIELKKPWDPDMQKRQKIQAYLKGRLPEIGINLGGSTTLDILPKGFNKASGLMRLLSKMGLSIADMVFVGDAIFPGGNDYSALEVGIQTIAVKGPDETAEIIKEWIS